jgi:hypothetical protein
VSPGEIVSLVLLLPLQLHFPSGVGHVTIFSRVFSSIALLRCLLIAFQYFVSHCFVQLNVTGIIGYPAPPVKNQF